MINGPVFKWTWNKVRNKLSIVSHSHRLIVTHNWGVMNDLEMTGTICSVCLLGNRLRICCGLSACCINQYKLSCWAANAKQGIDLLKTARIVWWHGPWPHLWGIMGVCMCVNIHIYVGFCVIISHCLWVVLSLTTIMPPSPRNPNVMVEAIKTNTFNKILCWTPLIREDPSVYRQLKWG